MAPPRFHPLVAGLVVLAGWLPASTGWAAPEPSPSEIGVARHLFDEARAAEDAGRWREAAEKFRSAIAIKDTPGMRFHLARCEEEQGAFVEALVEYDRARELMDAGVKAADVEKLLPGARERVRAKVALLTIKLPADVQNALVELDDQMLAHSAVGQPIPINPGKHRVTAVAVGSSRFAGEVELGIGEVKQISLDMSEATTAPVIVRSAPFEDRKPASGAATVTTSPTQATGDRVSGKAIALVGEGALLVAGLATGIGFTVAKSSANEDYTAAASQVPDRGGCNDPKPGSKAAQYCPPLLDALDRRDRDATIATVGFIGAGVAAAAFGLTFFLWPRGDSSASVHARASQNGLSVTLSGSF